MRAIYLWEALRLDGRKEFGILENLTRQQALTQLRQNGLFKIVLRRVPERKRTTPLHSEEILEFLNSVLMMLDAGITLISTLELLSGDQKSPMLQYCFCSLRNSLQQGIHPEQAFRALHPLFSDFFIAMIRVSEKSGNLIDGLRSLHDFYQNKSARSKELKRITGYPKIVFLFSLLISLGLIVFIVPMFEHIYRLYQGDLPLLTQIVVTLSAVIREYFVSIIAGLALFYGWALIPKIRIIHPVVFLGKKINEAGQKREDPLLYAHSIHILLKSGESIQETVKIAAKCMSKTGQIYGNKVIEMLQRGNSFSELFFELEWFPDCFHRFISSAEKAGSLQVGFEQVSLFIIKEREERFQRWSRMIEPTLMICMGALILSLLLSIYLPIFDLGNQIR